MTASKMSWTAAGQGALACCMLWLASTAVPAPGNASFTASFQPCDLPLVASGSNGVLARCQVEFAGSQGSVELVGQAPNRVTEVLFRSESNETVQRIAVSARPFIDPENVSIIVRDMNFDGMPDFGLRDFALTGANEPWQFWLWDEVLDRFVYHRALSKLPNPEVSTASQVVRAYLVDEHNNITTKTYSWHKGELVLQGISREVAR
ncbi:XAC2610-related protein [Anderseniella sp. Alg231-50]|uniref:XAC2610-related protein n=1 Tax=Anderseniella sp. Alg231-50 TaxID=1922226 RepID=UPI00307C49B5